MKGMPPRGGRAGFGGVFLAGALFAAFFGTFPAFRAFFTGPFFPTAFAGPGALAAPSVVPGSFVFSPSTFGFFLSTVLCLSFGPSSRERAPIGEASDGALTGGVQTGRFYHPRRFPESGPPRPGRAAE